MKALPLLLVLAGCASPQPPPLGKPARFLFLAVLEALYEQKVDPERTRALALQPGHFVIKCPICEPIRLAFRAYADHPRPMYGMEERELPAEIRDGLAAPDRDRRLAALQELVDRAVARRLERSSIGDEDRATLKTWLHEARRTGMSYKSESFGPSCPSCDGAALNR